MKRLDVTKWSMMVRGIRHGLGKQVRHALRGSAHSQLAAETNWAMGFRPGGAEDVYGTIVVYAEKQYYSMLNYFDNADKKADEHLRFMAGAVGAVIALLVGKLIEDHPYVMTVGGAAILGSFIMSLCARMPTMSYVPITPRELLTVAEKPWERTGMRRNMKSKVRSRCPVTCRSRR